jgi:hypothetical protein
MLHPQFRSILICIKLIFIPLFLFCQGEIEDTGGDLTGTSWELCAVGQSHNSTIVRINSSETYTIEFIDSLNIKGYDNCNTFRCRYSLQKNDFVSVSAVSVDRLYCPNKKSTFSILPPLIGSVSFLVDNNNLNIFYSDSSSPDKKSTLYFKRLIQ